ncbi:MAG: hypothetical protein CBD88_00780 [Flavobacteriales bacterium TMED228]|nr:MAG: hypothetical protein CBD88_00780 [Flavobacteriales bacterium TMED228]
MEIKNIEINKLIPYDKNPRNNKASIEKVASSIKEFGFRQPIVIDEKFIVLAGHTRLQASYKLGLKKVPVHIANNLSEAQKKAYRLMDNRSSDDSEWDKSLLSLEIKDLQNLEYDLDLTGFSDKELNTLMSLNLDNVGLTDENETPELPIEPTTKLGDLWLLGKHRLLCGDSTSIDAVDKLMDGNKADMVFTDPPYGMSYGGGRAKGDHVSFKRGGGIKAHGMIVGDDKRGEDLVDLLRDSFINAYSNAKKGASFYICLNYKNYAFFEKAIKDTGLEVNSCIVWDKKSIGLGYANYRPQHEFIFYCKGDSWHGDNAQSDLWSMSRGSTGEYKHPTQKPVELIEKAINNSSKKEDYIIDVFAGSGSTLLACEKLGRSACLMELDPKYCDVIIQRWENFTEKKAILDV